MVRAPVSIRWRLHFALFWNRGPRKLWNGLLHTVWIPTENPHGPSLVHVRHHQTLTYSLTAYARIDSIMSTSLHPAKWHWFFLDLTKNNKTTIYKLVHGDPTMTKIVESVEEFEVMKNYMFITTRKVSDYAVIIGILRSRYYQSVSSQKAWCQRVLIFTFQW